MTLLVALVAVPVLGAALAVLAGDRQRLGRWAVGGALAVHAGLAVALAGRVADSGRVETVVAGLPARVGIELVGDPLSALVVALVGLVAAGAVWYAAAVGVGGSGGVGSSRTAALFALLVAGLSGIGLTADLFNLYVFLEIAGLASYALVAVGDEGAPAALRYLFVGTVGATLYLLAVGYLYVGTGTLNVAATADLVARRGLDSTLVVAAFGLAFVGLAVKIPLVPVHTWLPDAHAKATVPASVVLSALVTTGGTYAFVEVLYGVFGADFLTANPAVGPLVSGAGAVSVVVGGAFALRTSKVKRVLAYSTVSQLGVVVVGVGLGTRVGLAGATIHLLGHAVTKAGLFFAAGIVTLVTDATTVEEYAGVADRAPVASAAFAVLALGMIGVPPTVGFAGKWYVLVGAAGVGAWSLVAVILVSSLLSLTYFGRILALMFFASSGHGTGSSRFAEPTGLTLLPVVAALGSVALGLSAAALETFLEPTISGLLA